MADRGLIPGAATRDTPPDADDFGLVVRPIFGFIPPIIVVVTPPTIGTTTIIPASVVPAVYLAANAARLGAIIENNSTGRFLFVKLGAGVTAASYTVRLGPHSYFEVPFPVYTGVIEGVWTAGAGGTALVTELT